MTTEWLKKLFWLMVQSKMNDLDWRVNCVSKSLKKWKKCRSSVIFIQHYWRPSNGETQNGRSRWGVQLRHAPVAGPNTPMTGHNVMNTPQTVGSHSSSNFGCRIQQKQSLESCKSRHCFPSFQGMECSIVHICPLCKLFEESTGIGSHRMCCNRLLMIQ